MLRLKGQTALEETSSHQHGKVAIHTVEQAKTPRWHGMHASAEGGSTQYTKRIATS